MKQFEISADSTCDLYVNEFKELGVEIAHLEYTMSYGDDLQVETDNFTETKQYLDFYKKLREGVVAKTSILSVQAHVDLFTRLAQKGVKSLLHFSQGYGLSPTVDNARQAIEIVKESFPDIDYIAIECDTTTVGEGMLLRCGCEMRDKGMTKEEAVKVLDDIKHKIQHFVIVNDLKFLARGGRISKTSANFGSLFQVKPILEFGRDGKLKVCRKELGLKQAMKSIVNNYSSFTRNKEFPYIYIAHTDNEPLAKELQTMLNEKYGIKPEIRLIGPIIGAHVGPGAVAYAFISNEERPYA